MRIDVEHRTVFTYDSYISDVVMELRLRPADTPTQRCHRFSLSVLPSAQTPNYSDSFGNIVHGWSYYPQHKSISIIARSMVETGIVPTTVPVLRPVERHRYLQFDGPVIDLPGVRMIAAELKGLPPTDALNALTRLIYDRFTYQKDVTNVRSTVEDVLILGAGVCQDFTHLWLSVARTLGIPARYVSGYLYNPPAGDARGAYFSHAWAEGWTEQGWAGHDPTNAVPAREKHIVVAVGRDYRDVAPTKGVYRGTARESLDVGVTTTLIPDEATAATG